MISYELIITYWAVFYTATVATRHHKRQNARNNILQYKYKLAAIADGDDDYQAYDDDSLPRHGPTAVPSSNLPSPSPSRRPWQLSPSGSSKSPSRLPSTQTISPSIEPLVAPSSSPSSEPIYVPVSNSPSLFCPTLSPSAESSVAPISPSSEPIFSPVSISPSLFPPTLSPSAESSVAPSSPPSSEPIFIPVSISPSLFYPTLSPSAQSSVAPVSPSSEPIFIPVSISPSLFFPTLSPSTESSVAPSSPPSSEPIFIPVSISPSVSCPTLAPSVESSVAPSFHPSSEPIFDPVSISPSQTIRTLSPYIESFATSSFPSSEPIFVSVSISPSLSCPTLSPSVESSVAPSSPPSSDPIFVPVSISPSLSLPTLSPFIESSVSPSSPPSSDLMSGPVSIPPSLTLPISFLSSVSPSLALPSDMSPKIEPTAYPSTDPFLLISDSPASSSPFLTSENDRPSLSTNIPSSCRTNFPPTLAPSSASLPPSSQSPYQSSFPFQEEKASPSSFQFFCPPNSYITQFIGRGSSGVNSLGAQCNDPDNTASELFGGIGGTLGSTGICSRGIQQINYYLGASGLGMLQPICGPVPSATPIGLGSRVGSTESSESLDSFICYGQNKTIGFDIQISGSRADEYTQVLSFASLCGPVNSTESFTINLINTGDPWPDPVRIALQRAKAKWESVIVVGLPDVPSLYVKASGCENPQEMSLVNLDDVYIIVNIGPIDEGGSAGGNILGYTRVCYKRNKSGLPLLSVIRYDSYDIINNIDDGTVFPVLLHEMGHALGYGSAWGTYVKNKSSDSYVQDTFFNGVNARAAFSVAGGLNYIGQKVPVENTGGAGTVNGHWRESVFANELMSPYLTGGTVNPLSVVTVASMEDIGYGVNYALADSWDRDTSPVKERLESEEYIYVGGDISTGDITLIAEDTGQVVKVIHG